MRKPDTNEEQIRAVMVPKKKVNNIYKIDPNIK